MNRTLGPAEAPLAGSQIKPCIIMASSTSAFSRITALSSTPGAAPVAGTQMDYLQHITRVASFPEVHCGDAFPVGHFKPVNTDNELEEELEEELMVLSKQPCDTHRPTTPLPTSVKFHAAPRKRKRQEQQCMMARARAARACIRHI